jgi:hypothetical protein
MPQPTLTNQDLIKTAAAIGSFYPDGIDAIRSMTVDDRNRLHVIGRDQQKLIEFTFSPNMAECQYRLLDDEPSQPNTDSDTPKHVAPIAVRNRVKTALAKAKKKLATISTT